MTHDDAEIRAASRRKKELLPTSGKRAKLKWREQDRREKEERRRLQAIINA